MDERQHKIFRDAGVALGELPEDYEGGAYLVTILWDGALDDEWIVDDLDTAVAQANAILYAEGNPNEMTILVGHVYVGPDSVESSGYGPYLTF